MNSKCEAFQHGVHCPKADHLGEGYLHAADDDRPYEVDGVMYCGHCHGWLGTPVPTPRAQMDARIEELERAVDCALNTLVCSCAPAGNTDVDDASEIRHTIEVLQKTRLAPFFAALSTPVVPDEKKAAAIKLATEQYESEGIAPLNIWTRDNWIRIRAQAILDQGGLLESHKGEQA